MSRLDPKLVDIFCATYGEHHRESLTPETSMADVEEWDSLSFMDLVFALEDAYEVEFTEDETAQMFQLGHIQRLTEAARLDLPHSDEANACCLIHNLRNAAPDALNVVLFSGSSTREGLLEPRPCEAALQRELGPNARWYNASVSGLVMPEMLQLAEQTGKSWKGVLVIGTSSIIYAGCGVAEFERSANMQRFPFASPRMQSILAEHGYQPDPDRASPPITLPLWVERYLKGRDLHSLQYDPYLYPTLPPWEPEKYDDVASILRFYNQSVLNFEESMRINAAFYEAIADLAEAMEARLMLVELTLHSKMKAYLEDLGGLMTKHQAFLDGFLARRGLFHLDAPHLAGLVDEDFRDPAHIFQKREIHTDVIMRGVRDLLARDG